MKNSELQIIPNEVDLTKVDSSEEVPSILHRYLNMQIHRLLQP